MVQTCSSTTQQHTVYEAAVPLAQSGSAHITNMLQYTAYIIYEAAVSTVQNMQHTICMQSSSVHVIKHAAVYTTSISTLVLNSRD